MIDKLKHEALSHHLEVEEMNNNTITIEQVKFTTEKRKVLPSYMKDLFKFKFNAKYVEDEEGNAVVILRASDFFGMIKDFIKVWRKVN